MSDDQQINRPRSSLAVWLIVGATLPIAYVLSVGPATWLHDHDYISESVMSIYAPLDFLGRHCAPAREFFRWYLRLWLLIGP